MARRDLIFNSFSAGEVSSRFEGRTDLEQYYRSCRTLKNMVLATQGGADRRPGTCYVANGKTDGDTVRLIPFELASGNYVLELGDLYIRFYKNHARIENAGTPIEIVTPWAKADLFQLKFIQTKDTLYVVHPSYDVKQLTRGADDNTWTLATVTFTGTTPPSFNSADNRPGAIALFEQKLLLAGSNNNPNRIWLSKPGDLTNFGTGAGEGLSFDIYHTRRLRLLWLAGRSEIVFGADNCEGILSGEGAPITVTNYQILVESGYGNANIQGLLVNDRVFYVQKGARRLREFAYSQEQGGWYSPDHTIHADHIAGTGFVQLALQTNPDTILWAVTADGRLAGFTYEKNYNVAGWHGQVSDGAGGMIESVSVVPGSVEDEIWVSVKRTVNGTTKRFIEYLRPRDFGSDQKDCFFVDSGITLDLGVEKPVSGVSQAAPVVVTCSSHGFSNGYKVKLKNLGGSVQLNNNVYTVQGATTNTFELQETGVFNAWSSSITYYLQNIVWHDSKNWICLQENINKEPDLNPTYWVLWPTSYTSGGTAQRVTQTVPGLGHLEGETAAVLADGAAHPDCLVSSGTITLNRWANRIHAGLSYESRLKPMRLVPPGKKKRIHKLLLRFYRTIGCKAGPDEDNLITIGFREGDDAMDQPPAPYSGDKEITFPTGYSTDGDILVVQDQPLPMHILMLMAEMDVNEIS
jgi:hypothetical protein